MVLGGGRLLYELDKHSRIRAKMQTSNEYEVPTCVITSVISFENATEIFPSMSHIPPPQFFSITLLLNL
jgi:hypothetical protein